MVSVQSTCFHNDGLISVLIEFFFVTFCVAEVLCNLIYFKLENNMG